AILVVVPNMESIASLVLLIAFSSALAAWVYLGSARISYAGVQIAFAFYVCVLQRFAPAWSFVTLRDRMIGILLGNAVITLVFLTVWPLPARRAVTASLRSALRSMAALARSGPVHQLRAQIASHFAAAQQSAEEDFFAWQMPSPEVLAERRSVQDFSRYARAVFAIQLALAESGKSPFDAGLAGSLDAIADGQPLPDLRSALDPVGGRRALEAELVTRVERLAAERLA